MYGMGHGLDRGLLRADMPVGVVGLVVLLSEVTAPPMFIST